MPGTLGGKSNAGAISGTTGRRPMSGTVPSILELRVSGRGDVKHTEREGQRQAGIKMKAELVADTPGKRKGGNLAVTIDCTLFHLPRFHILQLC